MSEELKRANREAYEKAVLALAAASNRNSCFFLCVMDGETISENDEEQFLALKAQATYNLPSAPDLLDLLGQVVVLQYTKVAAQLQTDAMRERN